jgi:hypothetical protein
MGNNSLRVGTGTGATTRRSEDRSKSDLILGRNWEWPLESFG